jgi:oxygen-dependent protoporphyrinogen oxidase
MQSTLPQFVALEKKYGSILKGMKKEGMGAHASGPRYGSFRSFNNGMQTLIDALANQLPPAWIRTNTLVQSVDATAQGQWQVRVQGQLELFDHVIFATPPRNVAHLANFLPAPIKNELRDISFASSAIAHFIFNQNQVDDRIHAMGMIVPAKEQRHILASTFCSEKFAHRAPQGKVLIRAFLGGAMQEDLLTASDQELTDWAWADLQALLDITGQPQHTYLQRWPNSMPQYTLGHAQRVEQIFKGVEPFDGIVLLGNGYSKVGIPDLMEQSAQAVAGLSLG